MSKKPDFLESKSFPFLAWLADRTSNGLAGYEVNVPTKYIGEYLEFVIQMPENEQNVVMLEKIWAHINKILQDSQCAFTLKIAPLPYAVAAKNLSAEFKKIEWTFPKLLKKNIGQKIDILYVGHNKGMDIFNMHAHPEKLRLFIEKSVVNFLFLIESAGTATLTHPGIQNFSYGVVRYEQTFLTQNFFERHIIINKFKKNDEIYEKYFSREVKINTVLDLRNYEEQKKFHYELMERQAEFSSTFEALVEHIKESDHIFCVKNVTFISKNSYKQYYISDKNPTAIHEKNVKFAFSVVYHRESNKWLINHFSKKPNLIESEYFRSIVTINNGAAYIIDADTSFIQSPVGYRGVLDKPGILSLTATKPGTSR